MARDLFSAIDLLKAKGAEICRAFVRSKSNIAECEIRFEAVAGASSSAEEGEPRSSRRYEEAHLGVTVRAIGKNGATGAGQSGVSIGGLARKPDAMVKAVRAALADASERALLSMRESERLRRSMTTAVRMLATELPARTPAQDDIHGIFRRDPREMDASELVRLTHEASKAIKGLGSEVGFDHVSAMTELRDEIYASSDGTLIRQQFAFSQGDCFVVAQSGDGHQESYDTIGQQRGVECLAEPWKSGLMPNDDLQTFALNLGREAVELARSPAVRSSDREVTIVTDPHFNALMAHEIVGHPSEADRALKMEAAYAGRSWLLRSLNENQIGHQIGSSMLSACSDPLIDGYGHYRYDHEGTPAARIVHIDKGVFGGFLNSRATAAALRMPPNGSARASEMRFVPLIRMSNTFFMAGDRKPEDIIGEVDHGYYVCGSLTPSIAESRENFRVSARRVYEIRNGQLGQLYRSGSIMGDSRRFFMNVDAVGNDLQLIAIPNCGKGQPMQVKRMSNGGPTLRSRAFIAGPAK